MCAGCLLVWEDTLFVCSDKCGVRIRLPTLWFASAHSRACECGLSAPRLRTRRTHDLSNGMPTAGKRLPTATERRVLTHYYICMGLGQCVKNY